MSNGNAVLLGEGKNRVREDQQEGKGGRRRGEKERDLNSFNSFTESCGLGKVAGGNSQH